MFTLNLEPWVQSSVPQSPLVTARISPTAMPGMIQNQSPERGWDSAQFCLQGPEEMGQTVMLLAEQITFEMLPPSHPGFPAVPPPTAFCVLTPSWVITRPSSLGFALDPLFSLPGKSSIP